MQMGTAGSEYAKSYGYNESRRPNRRMDHLYRKILYPRGSAISGRWTLLSKRNNFKELVEDNFFKIQSAWTKRDMSGVRNLLSPQMLKHISGRYKQVYSGKTD